MPNQNKDAIFKNYNNNNNLIISEEVSKCCLVRGLISSGLHLILKALIIFFQILN